MLTCDTCSSQFSFWTNFCEDCGSPLQRPIPQLRWTNSLPQSEVLNWLAQCERRLVHPIDGSERTGLSAYEYCWKAFNYLYRGYNGGNDVARMICCVKSLVNLEQFLHRRRDELSSLCEYVTGAFFVDFDHTVGDKKEALDKARGYAEELKEAIQGNDNDKILECLLRTLYALRNGRIHGHPACGTGRVRPPRNEDGPFVTLFPEFLLDVNVELLSAFSNKTMNDIRALIVSRHLQLLAEIKCSVQQWPAV